MNPLGPPWLEQVAEKASQEAHIGPLGADSGPNTSELRQMRANPADREAAEAAVRTILTFLGENPSREGLLATPRRVVDALLEMTNGSDASPEAILATTFTESCDEMVVVTNIGFASLCEHHLLPFTGVAHVGYLPNGRVVGLSKLPRLVNAFARRPQVQERMTVQIAAALDAVLGPRGVGVVVTAAHQCMSCRGVRDSAARMTTSAMLGTFRSDPGQKAEFLAYCPRP